MLDIKRIRQNPQELRDALKARNKDISIDEFLAQDEKRRTLMAQVEEKKALRNAESKKIGEIKKRGGSAEEVAGIMEEMRKVGDEIAAFDADIAELEAAMDAFLMTLPNFPHESVPLGKDDHDNVEKRRWGTPREFGWTPKAHWDIGTDLGILDLTPPPRCPARALPSTVGWALGWSAPSSTFTSTPTWKTAMTRSIPPTW